MQLSIRSIMLNIFNTITSMSRIGAGYSCEVLHIYRLNISLPIWTLQLGPSNACMKQIYFFTFEGGKKAKAMARFKKLSSIGNKLMLKITSAKKS
jgi:hypothetical protein